MSDMTWLAALAWSAVGLILICVAIVAFCVLRDRSLRGRRISNQEIQRERITITLPNFAMRDFKDRQS